MNSVHLLKRFNYYCFQRLLLYSALQILCKPQPIHLSQYHIPRSSFIPVFPYQIDFAPLNDLPAMFRKAPFLPHHQSVRCTIQNCFHDLFYTFISGKQDLWHWSHWPVASLSSRLRSCKELRTTIPHKYPSVFIISQKPSQNWEQLARGAEDREMFKEKQG